MVRKIVAMLAAGAIVLAGGIAYAQMHHGQGSSPSGGGMPHHGPGMMHGQAQGGAHGGAQGGSHGAAVPKGDQGPASLAFHGINAKMHAGMDITFTGNADVDFVRGMIPHHQGAVDMAKVVLAFGKDPELRKLAEAIVKAQEEEIAWMTAWLKKNGG